MKTLTKLLIPFFAGALFFSCNFSNQNKKSKEKKAEDYLILAKDSFVLDAGLVIKFSEDGSFKQYDEKGLLIRETEQINDALKSVTDNFYNKKNKLIKTINSEFNKNKLKKTDSTFYTYNEKGKLHTKEFFPAPEYASGSALFIYRYNNKEQLELEKRVYVLGKKEKNPKWVEIINYIYDSKGVERIKKWEDESGISYYLSPNDSAKIIAKDYDKDGLIDNLEKK